MSSAHDVCLDAITPHRVAVLHTSKIGMHYILRRSAGAMFVRCVTRDGEFVWSGEVSEEKAALMLEQARERHLAEIVPANPMGEQN